MLTVTAEQLEKLLLKYSGKLIDQSKVTQYQQFSLGFYANPECVSDGRLQMTLQLDFTAAMKNYREHYAKQVGTTIGAFVKWVTSKAMLNTPFNWRYINGQWYEFNNLPLEVSVCTADERQQLLYFLDDVSHSTWNDFAGKHTQLATGTQQDALELIKELPIYGIAQEIVGVRIQGLTHYNTTNKVACEHQPWIVFSEVKPLEGRLYLPFYISCSHSAFNVRLIEEFLNKLNRYFTMKPEQVYEEAKTLFNTQLLAGTPSFKIQYTPSYQLQRGTNPSGKEQQTNEPQLIGQRAKL